MQQRLLLDRSSHRIVLQLQHRLPAALRRGAWMCGPGSMDYGNLDSRDAPEPEPVPMGAQAARHLRWLAPRLTAVRELALLDWVRLEPATQTPEPARPCRRKSTQSACGTPRNSNGGLPLPSHAISSAGAVAASCERAGAA
jgi:hypothetical protein